MTRASWKILKREKEYVWWEKEIGKLYGQKCI